MVCLVRCFWCETAPRSECSLSVWSGVGPARAAEGRLQELRAASAPRALHVHVHAHACRALLGRLRRPRCAPGLPPSTQAGRTAPGEQKDSRRSSPLRPLSAAPRTPCAQDNRWRVRPSPRRHCRPPLAENPRQAAGCGRSALLASFASQLALPASQGQTHVSFTLPKKPARAAPAATHPQMPLWQVYGISTPWSMAAFRMYVSCEQEKGAPADRQIGRAGHAAPR